ncbi:DbpA/DbpB family decorin-binding adhesin [Borreliella lusitaniae]|uniref:DbpA/DbpB family decorin-binding adhesin n=1 Tax=Borreliella lusitaniae TaxID=100177 RepID=UPI002648BDAC|nr:DbpA/DbpB family decorin-binding adhesin [Borreliella lusitaniae]WKC84906.1 DbpA/DbpB family decorin-binding adhesin [Borreliella lusitaniae]
MNKNNKIIIKSALIASLLIACGLSGEVKEKLESSTKSVKDGIDKIVKSAAEQGVDFKAFTKNATGGKIAGNPTVIRKAKIEGAELSEKFLQTIEEEATKLKGSSGSAKFSPMFDLMLEVAEALEVLGMQGMKDTVLKDIEERPADTAERIIEIKNNMTVKLKKIKAKQIKELKEAEERKAKAATAAKKK